jgi:hypothetical protein
MKYTKMSNFFKKSCLDVKEFYTPHVLSLNIFYLWLESYDRIQKFQLKIGRNVEENCIIHIQKIYRNILQVDRIIVVIDFVD